MVMQLYVIVDRVAEDSGPVFEAKNDGVAIRNFRQMVEKSGLNPLEYKMLRMGAIDHDVQRIVVLDVPEEVIYE